MRVPCGAVPLWIATALFFWAGPSLDISALHAEEPDIATPDPASAPDPASDASPPPSSSGPADGIGDPAPTGPRPWLVETASGLRFDLGLEFTMRYRYLDPLELNGTAVRDLSYGDFRSRVDLRLGWKEAVRISATFDVMMGALLGDNGLIFGESPYPNEGMATTSRTPNDAGVTMVLRNGADPYQPDSYTYGLKEVSPLAVRRLWGEVNLVGFELRAGRMPAWEGRGILLNDGVNDRNRWGLSFKGQTADRVLLGTKPIEVVKALVSGDIAGADTRKDRGLFTGIFYDFLVQDLIQNANDNAGQAGASAYYLLPNFDLGAVSGGDLRASATLGCRFNAKEELQLWIGMFELLFRIEHFRFEAQAAFTLGRTREVSDAQSLIRNQQPTVQDIRAWGMLAILDYEVGPVTFTLELDFATGDDDPRPDTQITNFYFSEDTRVGLLMFSEILAFESARSATAATALFKTLGAKTYPSSRIDTRGAFTDAIAFFPQVTWNIAPWTFMRVGVLSAWTHKPLVDPVETLRRQDGVNIGDDLVNFHGGKPGTYYGTEIDLHLGFRLWRDHFRFDLEGGVLFPGDAFHDEHGDAVISGMVEGRFTFRY